MSLRQINAIANCIVVQLSWGRKRESRQHRPRLHVGRKGVCEECGATLLRHDPSAKHWFLLVSPARKDFALTFSRFGMFDKLRR